MRNLMVLGAAALLVVTLVADASAQCCGTAAPSYGYAAPAYHGGCGDCYTGGYASQCCDQGYRAPRVRVFARRQNCCPQPCHQPHNYCCAQPNCGGNNDCGTGHCNSCGTGCSSTMVACQPSGCGSCGSMYTGTTMGCGCNSGMVYGSGMATSGCPGCVQGQMIIEGQPIPAQGTIIEPGTENTPSAPANNNAAPPTPEDA
jgi:hypothetical protein